MGIIQDDGPGTFKILINGDREIKNVIPQKEDFNTNARCSID